MTRRERWVILAAAAMLTALATMMASVAHAQATGTVHACVSFPREKGPMWPRGVLVAGIGEERGMSVDAEGNMVIEGVSPGDYYLTMRSFGYYDVSVPVRVLPSLVSHVESRFAETVERLPGNESVMALERVPLVRAVSFPWAGPGKMRVRTGEDLARGARSSLFGVVAP